MKFKVGDKVKVIGNKHSSVNKIGDIGVIEEVDSNAYPKGYRVFIENRETHGNWHSESELEPVSEYPKKMLVWDAAGEGPIIRTVKAFVPELEFPYLTQDNDVVVWKYTGYRHAKDVDQSKELTMQEIADKFGINVEQLKIKK